MAIWISFTISMRRSVLITLVAVIIAASLLAWLGYALTRPQGSDQDPRDIILNQADLPAGWDSLPNASYVHTDLAQLSDPGAVWEAKNVFHNFSAPYGRQLIVYVVAFEKEEWAQAKFGNFNGDEEEDEDEELGDASSMYYVDNEETIPGTDQTYVSSVLTTVTFVDEIYFVMVQFVTEFTPEDEPFHIYTAWMQSIAQSQAEKIEGVGD
jgi:hypothetical protein